MSAFARRLQRTQKTPPVVVSGGYPTPTNTGVPSGTTLVPMAGDSEGHVTITTNNQVINGRLITGSLIIKASGVQIRNSQINGSVLNWDNPAAYSFTIQDSDVGVAGDYSTLYGIGDANYTALRVRMRGHGDGFRIGGPQPVLIQDCFLELVSNDPDDHSDGIQAYGGANNPSIVIRHNTIDQRAVPLVSQTSPIFLPSGSNQGNDGMVCTVENNLLASGGYSLRIGGGSYPSISGNKIVHGSYSYGPVDTDNPSVSITTWSGNATVTYDWNSGQVLSEVTQIPRP